MVNEVKTDIEENLEGEVIEAKSSKDGFDITQNEAYTTVSENIQNMNFFSSLSYDWTKSKKLKNQAIEALSLAIKAETQKLAHAYALEISAGQITNHKRYQEYVNTLLEEVAVETVRSASSMINSVETQIITGLKANKKTIDGYKELLNDGIISKEKYQKNVSSFQTQQENLETDLKNDLNNMFNHQRENLKVSLKNFIAKEVENSSNLKGLKS